MYVFNPLQCCGRINIQAASSASGLLAMSKLAALAAAGDSLTGAARLKAEALRVRDRRLALMSVQARA